MSVLNKQRKRNWFGVSTVGVRWWKTNKVWYLSSESSKKCTTSRFSLSHSQK